MLAWCSDVINTEATEDGLHVTEVEEALEIAHTCNNMELYIYICSPLWFNLISFRYKAHIKGLGAASSAQHYALHFLYHSMHEKTHYFFMIFLFLLGLMPPLSSIMLSFKYKTKEEDRKMELC